MKPIYAIDRASGTLDSQLLSSTTSGTFTISSLSQLGSQSWNSTSGYYVIITIDDEQILCSSMTESGGTVTLTIATSGRAYANTTAATHDAGASVELHIVKSMIVDTLMAEVLSHTLGLIKVDDTPTITSSSVLSVAGKDVTGTYTVGRVIVFKVSSTWYRAVVRSSSFSTNTTINVSGDGLPGSGTITDIGLEFVGSVYKAVDFNLVKEASAVPGNNPPSGYSWLFTKGGEWWSIDSSGNRRFLTKVVASVSSSGGTLVLDGAVGNVWDTTLTENISTITMQNCMDGHPYTFRVKQHASSAKTVSAPAAWRFGTTIASWTMTATVAKTDVLVFLYNSAASKYDVVGLAQGF